jgi:hypothetical protein
LILAFNKHKINKFSSLDTYAAKILAEINEQEYKSSTKPKSFKGLILKSLYHTAGLMKASIIVLLELIKFLKNLKTVKWLK